MKVFHRVALGMLGCLAAAGCAMPRAAARPEAMVRVDPAIVSAASLSAAAQVRRCYRAPRVPSEAKRIATRLVARYGADGSLTGLPAILSQSGVGPQNRAWADEMAEAAVAAVVRCTPLSLPQALGASGATLFELTFSPAARA